MAPVDLHTHSTASDGTQSPRELVQAAARIGLSALALTDHDTVNGLAEAEATSRSVGLELIRGCELATRVSETGPEMHLLGLWLPAPPRHLLAVLADLRTWRHERNHIILEKLAALGKPVSYDEVLAIAGDAPVARPHIAAAMLYKGYVASRPRAFADYLSDGGPAYAPKKTLSPEQALAVLKADQATTILAHPYLLGLSLSALEDLLKKLIPLGLDGLEAYHSEQPPDITGQYVSLAERLGLAISGGSDFHGAVKPTVKLGEVKGGRHIPNQVLQDLKAWRARQ